MLWTNCYFSYVGLLTFDAVIQIYSGITRGRVLIGELYTQRLQKLIYLFVYRLFHEDFSPLLRTWESSGPDEWREIFIKQSVDIHS